MWKPGDPKPENGPGCSSSTEQTPGIHSSTGTSSSKTPSSSAKKKLSGITMNMRFMQRKHDSDEQRRHSSGSAMEIDYDPRSSARNRSGDDEGEESSVEGDDPNKFFTQATPVDMYGHSFLGRRSFGGFNAPMETAWRLSRREGKAKSSGSEASDRELLKRYKDYIGVGKRRNQQGFDDSLQKRKRKTSLS